jgi:hypothetical protein
MPDRRVAFRPFCSWNRFTWEGCRLGHGLFDVSYERGPNGISAKLTNRNDATFEATFELTLPERAARPRATLNGEQANRVKITTHYQRPSVRLVTFLPPGQTQTFVVSYD